MHGCIIIVITFPFGRKIIILVDIIECLKLITGTVEVVTEICHQL